MSWFAFRAAPAHSVCSYMENFHAAYAMLAGEPEDANRQVARRAGGAERGSELKGLPPPLLRPCWWEVKSLCRSGIHREADAATGYSFYLEHKDFLEVRAA
eukprot:77054-Hanusia_phi.AAC.1